MTQAVASGFDSSAVQFDEAPDEGQPDAEAAANAFEGAVDLDEHVKDVRELVGRKTDSIVAYADDRLLSALFGGEADSTGGRRVLRGVVEQVREDLGHSAEIGVNLDRFGRKLDRQLVLLRLDERATGFDGTLNCGSEADSLLAEIDLVGGDAA